MGFASEDDKIMITKFYTMIGQESVLKHLENLM